MDTMTIIYIVVAFVVGAILTSIFKKGSNSTSSDNAKMQELEAENGSLKEKLSSISNERIWMMGTDVWEEEKMHLDNMENLNEYITTLRTLLNDIKEEK